MNRADVQLRYLGDFGLWSLAVGIVWAWTGTLFFGVIAGFFVPRLFAPV